LKVLVIGNGGREHALAWKLAQSPRVQRVFVAPGNAGTALDSVLTNVAIDPQDVNALADFAASEPIGLTVVGPEASLAAGVVDVFRARGLRIFGPTQAAAQLESSKAFAKAFMQRHSIATARHQTFDNVAEAVAYVKGYGVPVVVKADGLAAGKGVTVAEKREDAIAAVRAIFSDQPVAQPNEDGARVVIEEFMSGEEASFIVVSDGTRVVSLATSQDHKRLQDGDVGPNTGGMGAYSPAPVVTPNVHARVMKEIIQPTIAAMAREGMPFTGFLYAGLMIDAAGQPRVVEFNTRLGDPEAQVILMRLRSDLAELLMHAADGALPDMDLQWDRRAALGVVMAAGGYPQAPTRGDAITGLPSAAAGRMRDDAMVFHAGTALDDQQRVVTAGGRVLCVTALGDSVRQAQHAAYELLAPIRFAGAQHRSDIGHRGLKARS
jgi:phosphoribosylamine---glycine ligase